MFAGLEAQEVVWNGGVGWYGMEESGGMEWRSWVVWNGGVGWYGMRTYNEEIVSTRSTFQQAGIPLD